MANDTRPDPARLLAFTDAVAAIAITLLVLPLVDIVPEAAKEHASLSELFAAHVSDFRGFALSFVVIWKLWLTQHQIYRHIARIDGRVTACTGVWTFAVVFLPLPTAIITSYPASAATAGLYGGTLLVASGALAALTLFAARTPELCRGHDPAGVRLELRGSAAALVAEVVAVGVAVVSASSIGFAGFFLVLLAGIGERLTRRRRVRPAPVPVD